MESSAARVVGNQILIALISSALFYVTLGPVSAKAAFYGGAVAFINAFVYMQRVKRAESLARRSPTAALGALYTSAAIRFVMTLVLFGLGFGYFKLSPLPVIVTFTVAQLAYWWGLRR
jgi:ATP synthase protein I